MIDKKYIEDYIAKRRAIQSDYDTKINELEAGYKLAVASQIGLKVGDIVEVSIKDFRGIERNKHEEIIARIDICVDGTITINTATKNKGNGKWSRKAHFWRNIYVYDENDIKVIRHEDYNLNT